MRRFLLSFAIALAAISDSAFARGLDTLYGPFSAHALRIAREGLAIPTSDLLAGCGHGRYRDSATHRCRGPADITAH